MGAGTAGAALTMLAGAGMAAGCIAALASGWLASNQSTGNGGDQQATMNGRHGHDRYSFIRSGAPCEVLPSGVVPPRSGAVYHLPTRVVAT